MDDRCYPLKTWARRLIYLILGLMGVLAAVMVWLMLSGRLMVPLGLLPIGFLGYVMYLYLGIPLELCWQADGRLQVRGLMRTVTLDPGDIISLSGFTFYPGFLRLRHRRGRLLMFAFMDGLGDFISRLKAANPRVEIRVW